MPSRLITGAILVFWLGMTGWLIQREVVPMMLADAAPAYQIDLTEELEWTERNGGTRRGSNEVRWTVDLNGERQTKAARSRVVANEDRTYEFRSFFQFDKDLLKIEALGFKIDIEEMENMYRVTRDGKLLAVSAIVGANLGPRRIKKGRPDLGEPEFTFGIKGDVLDGQFEPIVFSGTFEHKLDKFDVPQQGNIVNPMHLVNRLLGLHDGKTWKITLVDPFEGLKAQYGGQILKHVAGPSTLIAKVTTDTLDWDRHEVSCYKIEYHEAGKDVTARTWVRKADGLVLRQESAHLGKALVLQRIP